MGKLGRILALVLVAAGVVMAARASTEPEPAFQPAPAAMAQDEDEEEEHGGDLVFHVVSRSQKYSVIYSHKAHLDAGLECADCHDTLFTKEMNGNHFKMSDINKGEACGVCHQEKPPEGVKAAFAPKRNCSRCHSVRIREPEERRR